MSINRKFKKCFITGITGSAGSFLADYILDKDKNIKIFGTYRSKKKLRYLKKKNLKRKKLVYLDLLNFNKLKRFLKKNKPDLIYHFASNADVRKSFDHPKEIILNNNNITLNLLEAIRELKLKSLVIICSTPENKNMKISENEIMKPQSPYAVSKCFQDLLAQAYSKSFNIDIIITRMFSYTNSRRFTLFQSSFAKQIVEIEMNKKKYLEHGNLNSIRTFIDIDDALEAYWLTAKKGKIGEIYNIGGNDTESVKTVLKKLIKLSTKKIHYKVNKKLLRPTDVKKQIPNCKKFKDHTNWKPNVSIDLSLKKLIEDLRLEFKK